ncbi:MAG TPA: hypothetical protein VFI24_27290 [Pyrinomonadaceae bacterium]|nr:hypothetical protein [Pyrinomonadaceae bacterium]
MSCFSAKTANPTSAELDPTKHVNYNVGMVLGVDDFTQEFAYLSGRDQWMARDLIGYGTVRGLKVGIDDIDTVKGPRVAVEPGVAISPRGQLICVPSAQCAYLRDAIESRSAEVEQHLGSLPDSVQLYVVICYRDCPTDNVPIAGEPCRSEDELTAPSRLTDSFHLELRFEKPKQREEEAIRDFVAWLKQVEVNETVTSTPLDDFLAEIHAAAQGWFWSPPDSPPHSPPGDFMSGSPRSVINSDDLCEYMRAAFRVWVTELRPKWIARWHGCAATHFDVDDKTEEDCVLLAKLTVPVIASSSTTWTVADSPAVRVDDRDRPFVVHLRMLQEWLWCGSCCETSRTTTGTSLGPSGYEIVAAGIVKADGTSREPVFNNLVASLQPGGQIALMFSGYQPPAGTFQYIVKALIVFQAGTGNAEVAFHSFGPAGTGILMNVSGVNAAIMSGLELMVEISRYESEEDPGV